jgi:hypothetical protein
LRFLSDHRTHLNKLGIPFFSVAGVASSFSVPYFQIQRYLALLRLGGDNDAQVTVDQARLGIAAEVISRRVVAHHWDLSYPALPISARFGSPNLDHTFPRSAALGAIVQVLQELELVR